VVSFFPNGFLPEIHSNINDLGVTIGVRRKGDWNVDASLTHGQNSFQFNVENSVNASLGTSSPTSFDAGTLTAQETVADLDLLRKIDTGKLKSLAFVLGTEVRNENYKIGAGDAASYEFGPQGGQPATPFGGGTSASTPASSPRSSRASTSTSAAATRTTATSATRSPARSRPGSRWARRSRCAPRRAPGFARRRSSSCGSATCPRCSSPTRWATWCRTR
jgi:iron complex outermembrane recepter protein